MFRIFILFSYLVLIAGFGNAQVLQTVNRSVTVDSLIHVNEAPGAGLVWLKKKLAFRNFSNGTIEFDCRGRDVLQKSFVGIAFHGVNDSTYDAIYFRPFNFQAAEEIRRKHSVQYISMPKYDWELLREEHPGKYENEITPAPDPNTWFHVKITVNWPQVEVWVNGQSVLHVTQLSEQKKGRIGYWVGNNSPGDWKNLTIK
jgi:hypothetical protein